MEAAADGAVQQTKKRPRTTIRNPYGKKTTSSLPPISNKPLYDLHPESFSSSTTSSSVRDSNAENSNAARAAPCLKAPPPSTTSLPSRDNSSSCFDDDNDDDNKNKAGRNNNNSTTTINTNTFESNKRAIVGGISISLPPWQRLPSQSLSFGSAEILSVTESVQHAARYHAGRCSIRCTGILEQVIHGNFPPPPCRRGSILPNSQQQQQHRPLPHLSVRLSDPLPATRTRTTTIVHNHQGDDDSKPSIPPSSSSSRQQQQPQPQLWVVFPTPDTASAIYATAIGSAVTVVGEPVVVAPLPKNTNNNGSHQDYYYWGLLQARLSMTVPPSTNLAMEWHALLLRRRFLLKQQLQQQRECHNVTRMDPQQEQQGYEEEQVLRLGCGPPPYST